MGTGSFPGGRGGRGVGLTPHHHLVPKVLEKSTAVPLLTVRVCVAYENGENLTIRQLKISMDNPFLRSKLFLNWS